VAKLGGFYDSKRSGRVGWAAMYQGWMLLQTKSAPSPPCNATRFIAEM